MSTDMDFCEECEYTDCSTLGCRYRKNLTFVGDIIEDAIVINLRSQLRLANIDQVNTESKLNEALAKLDTAKKTIVSLRDIIKQLAPGRGG